MTSRKDIRFSTKSYTPAPGHPSSGGTATIEEFRQCSSVNMWTIRWESDAETGPFTPEIRVQPTNSDTDRAVNTDDVPTLRKLEQFLQCNEKGSSNRVTTTLGQSLLMAPSKPIPSAAAKALRVGINREFNAQKYNRRVNGVQRILESVSSWKTHSGR